MVCGFFNVDLKSFGNLFRAERFRFLKKEGKITVDGIGGRKVMPKIDLMSVR